VGVAPAGAVAVSDRPRPENSKTTSITSAPLRLRGPEFTATLSWNVARYVSAKLAGRVLGWESGGLGPLPGGTGRPLGGGREGGLTGAWPAKPAASKGKRIGKSHRPGPTARPPDRSVAGNKSEARNPKSETRG
jgi:hypothetical protein